MKQEDKELLLKDICSRLPYGVKVQTTYINPKSGERKDIGIDVLTIVEISMLIDGIEEHKPYLFPMSSMTEEQKKEYESLCIKETSEYSDLYGIIFAKDHYYDTVESIDYLYKNHIDVRGLIPMGLAIDATNLNIY